MMEQSDGPFCTACADGRPCRDHNLSPAQLREKVEALEKQLHAALHRIDLFERDMQLSDRLDAALKRIESLERWSHSHTALGHVELTVHKTLREDKP